MDLNFQSFDNVNSTNEQSGGFGGNIGDRNNLVTPAPTSAPSGGVFDDNQSTTSTRKGNLFSFEYYQQFFDVETDQVVKRLLNSVVPTHKNYIQDFLQPIPDLWGPFWVSVTLVFSIGIFGNLAQFIENDGAKGSYGSDFRMVTSASTIIFLYVVVIPLLIYGLLWNRRSEMMHPYVDLMCLYGYSLAIFIPVTFLWIIDVGWFRWALIFISVGLSGTVLARAIWPAVQNDTNKMIAFGTIISVVVLHFLLAFTFKEFYFDAMHPKSTPTPTPSPLPPIDSLNITAPEAPNMVQFETSTIKIAEIAVVNLTTDATETTVTTTTTVTHSNSTTTETTVTSKLVETTKDEKNEKIDLKPTSSGIAENQ